MVSKWPGAETLRLSPCFSYKVGFDIYSTLINNFELYFLKYIINLTIKLIKKFKRIY